MNPEDARKAEPVLWRDVYTKDGASIAVGDNGAIRLSAGGRVDIRPSIRDLLTAIGPSLPPPPWSPSDIETIANVALLLVESHLQDYDTVFRELIPEHPDSLHMLSVPFLYDPDDMLNVGQAAKQVADVVRSRHYRTFYRPRALLIGDRSAYAVSTRQGVALRVHEEHGLYHLAVVCGE